MNSMIFKLRGLYLAIGLAGGVLAPYLASMFMNQGITGAQIGIIMAVGKIASMIVQPFWGMLVDKSGKTKLVLLLSLGVPALLAYFYNLPWFTAIIIVYTLSTIFQATQSPISDSYAVNAAKMANKSYGSIRSLGSLGNALGSYMGGLYVQLFSLSTLWIPFMLLNSLGLLAIISLPANTETKAKTMSFKQGLKQLFTNKMFVYFLIGAFLINQTLTAFNTYFVVAFQDIGGSYALSGIALLLASLTNIPSMLVASNLIKKYGVQIMLLVAAAAYILRWVIQWIFPIPMVVVGVQVLHGLSFGFFYVAAVEYVAKVSGPTMKATGQSVFTMIFSGLGGIVGNLLNGYLLDLGGPSYMYAACSISSLIGTAFLFLVVLEYWRNKAKTKEESFNLSV